MIKKNLKIENIPGILCGTKSDKLFIAAHGNISNKADEDGEHYFHTEKQLNFFRHWLKKHIR